MQIGKIFNIILKTVLRKKLLKEKNLLIFQQCCFHKGDRFQICIFFLSTTLIFLSIKIFLLLQFIFNIPFKLFFFFNNFEGI